MFSLLLPLGMIPAWGMYMSAYEYIRGIYLVPGVSIIYSYIRDLLHIVASDLGLGSVISRVLCLIYYYTRGL